MKGTAKTNTTSNIKPMDGGGAIAFLSGGQYVFGELSSQQTDIINFTHYYKVDGTLVQLSRPCKVTTANLILENIAEDEVSTPDPEPEPTPTIVYPDIVLVGPEGKQKRYIPEG